MDMAAHRSAIDEMQTVHKYFSLSFIPFAHFVRQYRISFSLFLLLLFTSLHLLYFTFYIYIYI